MTPLLLLALLSAEPSASWGLRWKAPAECRQAAELSREVEARLRRAVFGPEPTLLVDGAVDRVDGQWRARLTLVDARGTVLGTREVTTAGPDCAALDGKLALVLALLIDPSAALGAPALPQAPAPRLPPAPPLPPEHLFDDAPRVHVTLDADHTGVRLYRVVLESVGGGGSLVATALACEAPCGKLLPASDRYYVAGDGVTPSAALTLPAAPRVRLTVRAGNLVGRVWGVVLASLGASMAVPGLILLVVGAVSQGSSSGGLALAGGGLALGGAVSGGLGWYLAASNATTVTVER